jgi:hypothetical protein
VSRELAGGEEAGSVEDRTAATVDLGDEEPGDVRGKGVEAALVREAYRHERLDRI